MQEYRLDDGKVNYAVNVWGPVQVPINFVKQATIDAQGGKQVTKEDRRKLENRQMTFTWRGRSQGLSRDPETTSDNMTFRWRSWTDPTKKHTALLKFSFSSKSNAILVESWLMADDDAKTDQQFAQYET